MPETSATLASLLLSDPNKRPRLLDDCMRLVDNEVAGKGGLTGLAIKGGYKVVCALKPGIVRELLDRVLLDDFVARLEPYFAQHQQASPQNARGFGDFLQGKRGEVADALLSITDEKARRAKNPALKKVYDQLRAQAKKHVEEAIPGVARTLTPHLG